MGALYDRDFYSWALEQATALRSAAGARLNTPVTIDWENVAEEIESLAKSDARELWLRLYRLLAHLLKWEFQPDQRTGSWRGTIREQRRRIERLLDDSPGLRGRMGAVLAEAYGEARELAADETELPLAAFPEACPYSLEQAMDRDFWPEPEA